MKSNHSVNVPQVLTQNLVIASILFTAAQAGAVERYYAVPLPGAGSVVNDGEVTSLTGQEAWVVGRTPLSDGRNVPAVWDNFSGGDGSFLLTELPIPAGVQGTANDAHSLFGPTGEYRVVAGTIVPANQPDRAVVWTTDTNIWGLPLLLPDRDNGSRANGLIPALGSSRGDVAGEMTLPNGRVVPVVWTVNVLMEEIVVARLPIPAGTEGTANSITWAANGDMIAVGTLSRNDRTRAVQWTNDGEGWTGELLETPQGADSMIIKTGGTEFGETSAVASVGTICDEAGCIATLWGPGGNALLLPAVQKFSESTANSLFGDSGALAVVGEAFDEDGSVGAMFLPQADLAADVNKLLVNPNDITVTQVTAIEGGIMFGNGLKDGAPPVNCGIVMIPIRGVAAQRMNVSVGRVSQGNVISTWQNDGDRLRLRPKRLRGLPTIVAGFEARQIGEVEFPKAFVHLRCNGLSPDANSEFAVRVQLFNFATKQWETAGQFEATTTEACYSVEAPAAPATYVDDKNRVRTRLQIRRTAGNGRWEFEVNSLDSMAEGESCGI